VRSIYYGNAQQVRGVEEYYLAEGKASGIHMMRVRNGIGMEVEVCLDRCADITRVTFRGDNLGYFSPAGYVAPTYYDANGAEMIRSFTGGFLTTCGLDNVGLPCEIDGIRYPLHGRISNQPAEHCYWIETEDEFIIYATIRQAGLLMEKLELVRKISIGKLENTICVKDRITNCGQDETPCMILYHMNIGYPLLSEHAILDIPAQNIKARNTFAEECIEQWKVIEEPGSLKEEACYFHDFIMDGFARLFNPDINKGIEIRFDAKKLNCFTQWKMMGKYDYVMGLEPGNCLPNGRKQATEEGKLVLLKEQEDVTYRIDIKIVEE